MAHPFGSRDRLDRNLQARNTSRYIFFPSILYAIDTCANYFFYLASHRRSTSVLFSFNFFSYNLVLDTVHSLDVPEKFDYLALDQLPISDSYSVSYFVYTRLL